MLSLEEISALRVCVGAAIGEYGVSETTDIALQALAKIESVQQSVQSDGAVLSGCGIVFERYKDGVAVKYPLRTPRR